MVNEWFECKIKYERTMENGLVKKVSEPYLVEAISFSEAEHRIIEEISPYMTGEFQVSAVGKRHIAEIFWDEKDSADRWFKSKLTFITLDEKTGSEKKSSHYVLIQAADLRGAIERLDEGMKGSMLDYIISSIAETAYMDVYKYVESKKDKE